MLKEMTNWKDLADHSWPWAIFISCAEKEIENIDFNKRSEDNAVVRFLRGERCDNEIKLFQEFAAALQFPYYFGNNWDALDDCIQDFGWLPGKSYVLIMTNIDLVLRNKEDKFETLIEILSGAAKYWQTPIDTNEPWAHPSIPFHVVFHCEKNVKEQAIDRFRNMNLEVTEILLKV
jgi:RNAse (barnase) inhibitor barstar